MTKKYFEPKKMGRPTNRPSIEELSDLYAKHTSKEIAAMYNVKPETVSRWVWMYRKQLAAEEDAQGTAQEEQ